MTVETGEEQTEANQKPSGGLASGLEKAPMIRWVCRALNTRVEEWENESGMVDC
jgi:hypothetical protein